MNKMGNDKRITEEKIYEIKITASDIISTDDRFTMNDLTLGDNYKPINVYFKKSNGDKIYREYNKRERKNSNQSLPRLACQVFESQLSELSEEEKNDFPICRYNLESDFIKGIFPSVDEFKSHRKSIEFAVYKCKNNEEFVFYCWNIFTTIIFVQECLKRFGNDGDEFILTYKDKELKEVGKLELSDNISSEEKNNKSYLNSYSKTLINAKNLILRGAPGTGKTYLAKQIAADLVSSGRTDKIEELTENEKNQIGFVQFHPSYDYTDFVEGLRPRHLENNLGFELESGIFKLFCERAKEKVSKSGDKSIETIWYEFIESIGDDTVNIKNFKFKANSRGNITYTVPGGSTASLTLEQVKYYLENHKWSEKNYHQNYKISIFEEYIKPRINGITLIENKKPYVFIIDEINRGEISKIFGELFFSIDPGYRGKSGGVLTQYSNLHENPNEKFYIPENVYIIGTMNDIDRSVDTFDFAMRRRFRFIEIKAGDNVEMLEDSEDLTHEEKNEAIGRMQKLNKAISEVEGLNANYHIGPSYFLKLKDIESSESETKFDKLWTDYLSPLLQDYVRGMYNEEQLLEKFEVAYNFKSNKETEPETENDTEEN